MHRLHSGTQEKCGFTGPAGNFGFAALVAVAVLFVFAGAASAQNQQEMRPVSLPSGAELIKRPTQTGHLPVQTLHVATRPKIMFKPFEMVDPKTNKPIAPTAKITLPNGKTPTAQEYYDQLNSFEKYLNDNGYSLRTTPKNTTVPFQELTLNRALINQQIMTAPKASMLPKRVNFLSTYSFENLSAAKPIQVAPNSIATARITAPAASASEMQEATTKLNAAHITGAQRDGMVIGNPGLREIAKLNLGKAGAPSTPCTKVDKSKNWNWDVGDPSTFHAYINGSVSLSGNACKPANMSDFDKNDSNFTLAAEGKAGGTVFGVGGDLLRITANMGGNQQNNTVSAGLGIFVVGQSVFSVNKTANAQWGTSDSISKGVDFSTSIPIPVGPFDIDATIGAQGSAGFKYSLQLYPISLSLSGGPFVHTNVYAQAGLNVVVAEAGVGVNLVLVNWDMNLGGSGGVGWLFKFYVYDDLYADSDINLLAGSIYIYAKVYYPCLDPWPDICNSQWQTNLWSWNGLQYNSVLFDEKDTIPLNW